MYITVELPVQTWIDLSDVDTHQIAVNTGISWISPGTPTGKPRYFHSVRYVVACVCISKKIVSCTSTRPWVGSFWESVKNSPIYTECRVGVNRCRPR